MSILFILGAFLSINGFFSILGFIVPTLPADKILPIQVWLNALLVFSTFLPSKVARFLDDI